MPPNLSKVETDLLVACEALLAEFDKLSRYGSPMAIAANEAVTFARSVVQQVRSRCGHQL